MNFHFDPLADALRRAHPDLELNCDNYGRIPPPNNQKDIQIAKLTVDVEFWKNEADKHRLKLQAFIERLHAASGDAVTPVCAEVIHFVAEHFRVSIQEIKGTNRANQFVHARHVAMYLIRKMTMLSFPQISRVFNGRDHTTAMHAHRKITALRETDPALEEQLAAMETEIRFVAVANSRRLSALCTDPVASEEKCSSCVPSPNKSD